jgi:hypothetical protein
MHTALCLSVLATLVPFSSQSAQAVVEIEQGTHVHITAPDAGADTLVVAFQSIDVDTLRALNVVTDYAMSFPIESVTKIELRTGRKPAGTVRFAAIGAVACGLTYWFGFREKCVDVGGTGECDDPLKMKWGVVAVAAGGAVVGGLLGTFIKVSYWEEVPLDQLRVQPVATPDGRFGLAASLRF